MVEEDLNFVSPLHVCLRTWDFVFKLIVRLRVPLYDWQDSDFSRMLPYIKKEKQHCIDFIANKTGKTVEVPDPTGQGGTSTNGPVIENLFGENIHVLIYLVPEQKRDVFGKMLITLTCLLNAYTSNKEINVAEYKERIKDVYNFLVNELRGPNGKPWIYPSPTVHSFLSHSSELIESNNSTGLGKFSEQGLENNNKMLRFYQKFLSRKCSQHANLTDCFTKLWLQSDPIIQRLGRKIKPCKHCGEAHSAKSCPEKYKHLEIYGHKSFREVINETIYS